MVMIKSEQSAESPARGRHRPGLTADPVNVHQDRRRDRTRSRRDPNC